LLKQFGITIDETLRFPRTQVVMIGDDPTLILRISDE